MISLRSNQERRHQRQEPLLDAGVNLPEKAEGSEAVKAVLRRYG